MWIAISLVQVWTRVAVSISYDDNHYTTGTSFCVNTLPFVLKIVIKDPLVVICNNILEKSVISILWKKTCCCKYAIFIIPLTKSISELAAHYCNVFLRERRLAWDEVSCLFEHFWADWIPPFLKHLNWGWMKALVCFYLSMTYR